MPYNNTNLLTDKEFYTGVSRLLGVTPVTVKRYWEDGFYEFIIRQLYFAGTCRVPHLGTFSEKHMNESISVQTDKDGNTVTYRIPERDIPIFTPHDTAINDVNMQGVTKKFRKRMKKNQLTQQDINRRERAEKLGVFGSMSQERVEQSKEDFKELLTQKKKEKEGES